MTSRLGTGKLLTLFFSVLSLNHRCQDDVVRAVPVACDTVPGEESRQAQFSNSPKFRLCAAKAIFYCPTMNSHRPRSQNTAKEQAFIPEKDSRRTWPRCHVSLEKSSKNHKPVGKMSQTKPSPWRHTTAGEFFWGVFSSDLPRGGVRSARIICCFFSPLRMAKTGERAGWFAV